MLSSRGKVAQYIRKRIGNGQTTSLWYDPWLKSGRLVDLIDSNPTTTHTASWNVSNIVEGVEDNGS